MTEVLFTLTTIYVAYVIYGMVNSQASASNVVQEPMEKKIDIEPIKPDIVKEVPPVIVEKKAELTKPKVSGETVAAAKGSVRHPQTGEVAAVNNNYRFTKRWIKEALVAEGLLTKVYKNNELDAASETAIKHAMMALAAMEKYRV